MLFLSGFFSAFVWMLLGSMILRSIAFRHYSEMRGVRLATVATPVIAIVLAMLGLRMPGVPGDVMGAAKIYVPAAIAAGLLLALLARRHHA
jgi:hypothetical protein